MQDRLWWGLIEDDSLVSVISLNSQTDIYKFNHPIDTKYEYTVISVTIKNDEL